MHIEVVGEDEDKTADSRHDPAGPEGGPNKDHEGHEADQAQQNDRYLQSHKGVASEEPQAPLHRSNDQSIVFHDPCYLGRYRKPGRILAVSVVASLVFMFIFMKVVYISLPLGVEPFAQVSEFLLRLMHVR